MSVANESLNMSPRTKGVSRISIALDESTEKFEKKLDDIIEPNTVGRKRRVNKDSYKGLFNAVKPPSEP